MNTGLTVKSRMVAAYRLYQEARMDAVNSQFRSKPENQHAWNRMVKCSDRRQANNSHDSYSATARPPCATLRLVAAMSGHPPNKLVAARVGSTLTDDQLGRLG